MGTLLQTQSLKPEIASELVRNIPAKVPPTDRVAILSKLLVNGATGPYCSEQLILAAESNDLDTAQLLITYGGQNNGPPVCSVNYNGARCLKTAVSRNNIALLKLLALEGDPTKFSLAQAFSAIPPNVTGDDHFLIVQTLLRGGAVGPEVDEALYAAVVSPKKSHRLIEVLIQFKANVTEPTLLAAVSQGSTTKLDVLLTGSVSSSMCAAAITTAMKLPMTETRFKIISKLLVPATTSNAEIREVSQAVLDILQHCPEDMDLLDLLCRQGKANLNFEGGLAVLLATKHSNYTLLTIILQAGTFLPSSATIERALECAISLPLSDVNRPKKFKALLWKVKPQTAINKALIQEITSALKQGQRSPVIKILLDAGADVNAENGKPIRLAVNDPALMGLLLSKTPTVRSVSSAVPAAVGLKDPERFMLCEKLLRAGATGEEIGKAFCLIVEEGLAAVSLMRLFLKAGIPTETVSDALIKAVNLGDLELSQFLMDNGGSAEHQGGQAVCSAASAGNTEMLRLLVSSKPSLSTLFTGFGGAMSLTGELYRQILQILLEAGMRGEAVDDALVETVRHGDESLKMTELLCKNGASIEYKEGEATAIAARSAMLPTLDLLLAREPSQPVLRRAFIEASTSTLSKSERVHVIERLLKAGKQIDSHVTKILTTATMAVPSDRSMIKMLLAQGVFDEGQAMVHATKSLDLRTLTMLVNSPKASTLVSTAFEAVLITNEVWQSATGLAVVKLLLEKGASGPAVAEALYRAVESLESTGAEIETLAYDFIKALLKNGADVNYQRGLSLQRATLQANIPLITKLLPGANPESKAMAIPYVFTVCDEKVAVLKTLAAFVESFDNGEESLDIMFRHPDENLEPVLFLALNQFPRDTQILRALLDMGYPPNQWQFCASEEDVTPERWPILCWALDQPQKKISNGVIEMLIDAGADVNYTSKTGITPLMLAIQNQRVDIVSKLIARGANVAAEDSDGITPLALASSMNNIPLMECLLEADAEVDDGSLHDVAAKLQLDKMRILIKYGHRVDYPSDRHDGRSALAELSLRAVDDNPTPKHLENVIQFLIVNDAKIAIRNVCGKTIFHYALDSSNPVLILTALLKIMWEHINGDAFLYSDKTYTYSLTKYVEKDLYQGPRNQKEDIIALLRKKQAIDRFWAHDIMSEQPSDYCNGPPHIEEEVLRQKARAKRQAEMREDTSYMLDLKRMTAIGEVEISEITLQGEIQRTKEKARIDRELLQAQANTQLQISEDAFQQSSRLQAQRRLEDVRHQKQLGDVQVNVARMLRQEELETDRSKNMMQIEYLDKKIEMENGGFRQRLAIEEQAKESMDRVAMKGHEREMARIKMQKQLLGQQQSLANSFQGGQPQIGGYPGQRQIGFISEV
ncbi:putative ankyrin repeat protein [Acephala macrosclerotiorum]|nr:putative ankyrin repeat protein [Acephala macrosclerotiorum]